MEWEGSTSSAPRYVDGNRCLPTGMGSTMRRFAIRRPVDHQGAIHAHKLLGALGGSVCGENICQTGAEPPHLPTNGQHNCCGIYQQDGRYTVKHPIEHGVQSLAMVPSRPFLHEHRCLSGKMDWLPGVCFPSICSGGKVPPKSEEREKLTIDSSPSTAITSLAPSPSRVLSQKSSANTDVQQHTPGSFRSPTPNGDPRAAPVTCMEGLRKNHRAAGISERSSKLILSGWSKGTTSSYQSGKGN